MAKLEPIVSAISSRKAAVLVGIVIIFLVIIDLLVTRQVLPSYKEIEITIFVLTVTIGYGIGSWILLGYIGRVSKEIRAKSRFINVMHWTVKVVQFSLLGYYYLYFLVIVLQTQGFYLIQFSLSARYSQQLQWELFRSNSFHGTS